jgi:hypothetical protein
MTETSNIPGADANLSQQTAVFISGDSEKPCSECSKTPAANISVNQDAAASPAKNTKRAGSETLLKLLVTPNPETQTMKAYFMINAAVVIIVLCFLLAVWRLF